MNVAALTNPIDEKEQIRLSLEQELDQHYGPVEFVCEGGTRYIFRSKWGVGENKTQSRFIKVDKSEVSGPRSQRHVGRGYDTSHDMSILSDIDHPNIVQLVDTCNLNKHGNASIELEFQDAKTLDEIVSRSGALSVSEFEDVFTGILEAERYLVNEKGIYHRDAKPANILVRKTASNKLQAKLTDLANAAKKEDLEKKVLPTAGAHAILHPQLSGIFTQDPALYSNREEIYALGVDMFFALTGEYIFDYDPDEKTATEVATNKSLLDTRGILNERKHESALEKSIKTLPKGVKKYAPIIRKCLTLDEKEQYDSIDSLATDFTRTKNMLTPVQRLFRTTSPAGLVAVLLMAATGLGLQYTADQHKGEIARQEIDLAVAKAEVANYPVSASWNIITGEVENNLITIETEVYSVESQVSSNHDIIQVQPGEKLSITVYGRDAPGIGEESNLVRNFKGRMYIEGYSPTDFFIDSLGFGGSSEASYIGPAWKRITVPEDANVGVGYFITEIYAPEEGFFEMSYSDGKFIFDNPGKIIARERIPIIIGNPEDIVGMSSIDLSYTNEHANFKSPKKPEKDQYFDIPSGLEYSVTILDTDLAVSRIETGSPLTTSVRFNIKEKMVGERTIQTVVRREENIVSYSFTPITGKKSEMSDFHLWHLGFPGPEFSDQIVEYRKDLFDETKEK